MPAANFAGTTTFTYRASDGTNLSGPTTVTLNFANTPDNRFATSYFRREFQVTDLATITGVEVMLLYDDAGGLRIVEPPINSL